MTTRLVGARAALTDQSRRPALGADFAAAVMDAVHTVVPFDGYALLGLDPCSGMRSYAFSRNGLDGVAKRLAYNEHVESDVNRYADLAVAPVPVGVLSTGGSRESRSPRLHEILRPAGFSSELRLSLRSDGRLWGALVLFRGDRGRPFTDADARLALELAAPLRAAVRRYPVRRATGAAADPLPPGVVLLDRNNEVVSMSAEASAWLDDVRPGGLDEMEAEDVMRVVFDVGLAALDDSFPIEPVCRVRTTSGRWLVVHGARLTTGQVGVAVVLQPASLRQVLPAAAEWFGLTRRETQVLQLIADGLSAKVVARQLQLSVLTVNDHLGAIRRKANVSGREELLAGLS